MLFCLVLLNCGFCLRVFVGCVYDVWKTDECSEIRFVSVEETFGLTASCNATSNKLRSDVLLLKYWDNSEQ
jgi:hypothetical protein